MRHVVVMVTSSYPRFPGDTVGTFLEPIARGLAARGHDVHVVAPWHPQVTRAPVEEGVRFHFFRYAPLAGFNVFGYAEALQADIMVRRVAWLAAPFAVAAGWRTARRVARTVRATILHGHWVVPGGLIASLAAGRRPLVVSLHGSDAYVAERHRLARAAARRTLGRAAWVTACSLDLGRRAVALGARPERLDVLPYGVDTERFRPDPAARAQVRCHLGLGEETILLFAAGRLVHKKGFEYLLDAVAALRRRHRNVCLALAGAGDLDTALRERAARLQIATAVRFLGPLAQTEMPRYLAAADIVVVPSVHDEAGNVDGLPNVVMEALASGAPLVATTAGGIPQVVTHGETALLVPERDAEALAGALDSLIARPDRRRALGAGARALVEEHHTWRRFVERLEGIYDGVANERAHPHGGAGPIAAPRAS